MELIRSNLLFLFLTGAVSVIGSIFWEDLKSARPLTGLCRRLREMGKFRGAICTIGLICIFLTFAGAYSVMVGAPGGEDTIVEPIDDIHIDDIPGNLVQVLQASWDSNSEHSNWPVARAMGEVSLAAYLPPVEAESRFVELGYEEVSVISDGSLLGYVLSAKGATVIVFRGTDDPADWIVNLDTRGSNTANGTVHRGFFEAYLKLSPQVNSLLAENPPMHVWITGHSMGGALAAICAYDLSERHGRSIDGLVTFGQPMVARSPLTKKVEELLPARYVHFVNEQDIVTRIPPSYAHCGELVHYVGTEIRRSKRERLYGAAEPGKTSGDLSLHGDSLDPLSEAEFASLKRELKEEQAQPDFSPDGQMLYKGSSPFIQDHAMELYLDRLR